MQHVYLALAMEINELLQKLREERNSLDLEIKTLERISSRYPNGVTQREYSPTPIATQNGTAPQQPLIAATSDKLVDMVAAAANSYAMDQSFTKNDVVEKILLNHPTADINPASVSSILWKMEQRGRLALAERGHGKKPSKYRRQDRTDHAPEVLQLPEENVEAGRRRRRI